MFKALIVGLIVSLNLEMAELIILYLRQESFLGEGESQESLSFITQKIGIMIHISCQGFSY